MDPTTNKDDRNVIAFPVTVVVGYVVVGKDRSKTDVLCPPCDWVVVGVDELNAATVGAEPVVLVHNGWTREDGSGGDRPGWWLEMRASVAVTVFAGAEQDECHLEEPACTAKNPLHELSSRRSRTPRILTSTRRVPHKQGTAIYLEKGKRRTDGREYVESIDKGVSHC